MRPSISEPFPRRKFLRDVMGAATLPLLGSCARETREPGDRPNFLVIVADDLGIDGVGAYGGGLETPRIDALAGEGLRFENAYSTPLCTPSRVQLLTGQYPFRTGWLDNIQSRLDADSTLPPIVDPKLPTFGKALRDFGYQTACAGKWQLCRFDQHPGHVADLGFDTSRCWLWVKEDPENPGEWVYTERYWRPSIIEDGVVTEAIEGHYGPDLYSEFLIDFMAANRDRPFLAYYPMALPHPPFQMTPHEIDPASIVEVPWTDATNFPRMVHYMDYLVGRLVDAVDQLGIAKNTVILFLSDNGTPEEIRVRFQGTYRPGGKSTMSEKGMRVPFIARWAGSVLPGVAEDLIDLSDVMPTLLDLAGAPAPGGVTLDGRSIAPLFRSETLGGRDWIYSQLRDATCVRQGPWKLYSDDRLFNLNDDPLEKRDRADDPIAVRRKNALQKLLRSIGA